MNVRRRTYRPGADFGRVRDFLVRTHTLFDPPLKRVHVGSGQEFYKSLGFEARFTSRLWLKGFACND